MGQPVGVLPRDLAQPVRRVRAAVDPVRAALQDEVAVAVDQRRDQRGATGVNDLLATFWIGIAIGPKPDNVAVFDS